MTEELRVRDPLNESDDKHALCQEEDFPPKKVLLILSMKEGRYSNEAGHVSL